MEKSNQIQTINFNGKQLTLKDILKDKKTTENVVKKYFEMILKRNLASVQSHLKRRSVEWCRDNDMKFNDVEHAIELYNARPKREKLSPEEARLRRNESSKRSIAKRKAKQEAMLKELEELRKLKETIKK